MWLWVLVGIIGIASGLLSSRVHRLLSRDGDSVPMTDERRAMLIAEERHQ